MRKRNPFLWLPLTFLAFLLFVSVFADRLGPYSPQEEHRLMPFHPPTALRFCDEQGSCSPRPFVYAMEMSFAENYRRIYTEDKTEKHFVRFGGRRLMGVKEPGYLFLFGTDSRGRDLFSRILHGGRISLSVGILGASIAALIGLFVGAASGYHGGKLDGVLMRMSEFFIMIPAFYFLLALRSALPPEMGSRQIYFMTIAVLSLIGWGGIARVIRGLVLSIRQQDFIAAAKILGRSDFEIIRGHVIPHTFSYLLIVVSISIPSYILMESALSLLGLGIQEPDVSWGSLLSEALSVAHIQLHPWVLLPGLFLFLTAWSFNVLGDALRESS